ncbi:MAG: hypothetical protein AB7O67_15290 [Vicinamibacterales bacterium]
MKATILRASTILRAAARALAVAFLLSAMVTPAVAQVRSREAIALDYARAVEMFNSSRALESGPLLDGVVDAIVALPDPLRAQDRDILKRAIALRAQLRLDLDQEAGAVEDLSWITQLDANFEFDAASVSPKVIDLLRQTRNEMTGRVRLPNLPRGKIWLDGKRLDGVPAVSARPGSHQVRLESDGAQAEGNVDVRANRETEVTSPRTARGRQTAGSTGPSRVVEFFVHPPRIFTVRVGTAIDFGSDTEPAPISTVFADTTYTWQAPAGFGTELGGTLRVPRTPFSLGVTRLTTKTTFTGAFDTGANEGNARDLLRTQEALHFEIGFSIGGDHGEFAVFGGPSFISAKQSLVTTVNTTARTYSFQNVETDRVRGFNIGLDGAWMFAKYVGVGAGMRYTRAFADVSLLGRPVRLQLGGYQMGMGARIRF